MAGLQLEDFLTNCCCFGVLPLLIERACLVQFRPCVRQSRILRRLSLEELEDSGRHRFSLTNASARTELACTIATGNTACYTDFMRSILGKLLKRKTIAPPAPNQFDAL